MPAGFGSDLDRSPCPCGGGDYGRCCAPLHRGERSSTTAEQLMRSRYSAFVRQELDYLLATHLEPDVPLAERRRNYRITCRQVQWTRLRIVATEGGGLNDCNGVVRFEASHSGGVLRETSFFQRRDGHLKGDWLYIKALAVEDKEMAE